MPKTFDDWQTAKKQFETLTGKKKPSESFFVIFRKSSGMEDALKACDKASEKSPVDVAAFEKAYQALEKTANDYLKMLKEARTKEKDKDVATVLEKGLANLGHNVKKYLATFETQLETAKTIASSTETNPMKKAAEVALKTFDSNLKSALAGAKAASDKIYASKMLVGQGKMTMAAAVANYNQEMDAKEAARKVATALGAYGQIQKFGGDVGAIKDPKSFITDLTPFASGNLKSIGNDTTAEAYGKHADTFAELIKKVKAAYF